MFPELRTLSIANTTEELYNSVLVDTPLGLCAARFPSSQPHMRCHGTQTHTFPCFLFFFLHSALLFVDSHCLLLWFVLGYFLTLLSAPYFLECVSRQDLDELNIEIIRNTLYRAYIEDFYKFCASLGDGTQDVMCEILAVSCL